MKSTIREFAVATFVALASLSPAMHAQIDSNCVRVNVPFSFDYGAKHFARGVYNLAMDGENILIIRSAAESAMAVTVTGTAPMHQMSSEVVFRKYGDRYFLEEVLIAGGADIIVNESRAEKRAARELALRGSQPSAIALAFLTEPTLGH